MEHFDVIIVGAGPAGLKCAEELGNSQLSVLVLEKNSEVGPKICAGGLSRKSLDFLDLPKEIIDSSHSGLVLNINNRSTRIKNEEEFVYTVDRKKLGQWQLRKLDQYPNIRVRTNSLVSEVTDEYSIVNGEKIFFTFLVGADGSASLVRKYLKLETKKLGLAMQYILPGKGHEDIGIFFQPKLFSAWYAWIFPHRDYVSIGCGCDPRYFSVLDLANNFEAWLKENNINVGDQKKEAFPINYDYQGHRFGNIFLAGDAAGLASGFTGEGIYQALVSGSEIAHMIRDHSYSSYLINELLKTKRQHDIIQKLFIKSRIFRSGLLQLIRQAMKIPVIKKAVIDMML